MAKKLLYFAYASNMLSKRIHINNPNAVRYKIGKIENYQLDFNYYSKRWQGASATIVPKAGRCVWGAIWEVDDEQLEILDRQEGAKESLYRRFEVDVLTTDDNKEKCWVYQQTQIPEITENILNLAEERKPSKVYWRIINDGAKESNLPESYQQFLGTIPHNGYDGEIEINLSLSHK